MIAHIADINEKTLQEKGMRLRLVVHCSTSWLELTLVKNGEQPRNSFESLDIERPLLSIRGKYKEGNVELV